MNIEKTKPHAVFLDIDGTLMPHGDVSDLSRGHICEKNIRAIQKAKSAGHKIIINTGRGFSCMPKACFSEIEADGVICALGSYIELSGKTVFNKPLEKELLGELIDYISAEKKPCRFQGTHERFVHDPNRTFSDFWTPFKTKEEFFEKLGDGFISKITIDYDMEGEYFEFLKARFNTVKYTTSGEATSIGCTKAGGMNFVLEALGIPKERGIAMGDSENDREMLTAAGIPVAMGNAPDTIKALCAHVTLTEAEGGVGEAIEKLLF